MSKEGCCPRCGVRFSDWFVWCGERHCLPCWVSSGYRLVVREFSGPMED